MYQNGPDKDPSSAQVSTLRGTGRSRAIADFGSDTKAGLIEWLGSKDDEDIISPLADLQLSSSRGQGYVPTFEAGWRQPKFQPGRAHERMLARERLLPPKLGGRSKTEQLGSIEASWGEPAQKAGTESGGEEYRGQGPVPKGMFELIEDPPSRSTSPFKVTTRQEEIEQAKAEAWARARKGTSMDLAPTTHEHRSFSSTLNRDYTSHAFNPTTSYPFPHQDNDSAKYPITVKHSHSISPSTRGGDHPDSEARSYQADRRYLTAEYARCIERERARGGARGRS